MYEKGVVCMYMHPWFICGGQRPSFHSEVCVASIFTHCAISPALQKYSFPVETFRWSDPVALQPRAKYFANHFKLKFHHHRHKQKLLTDRVIERIKQRVLHKQSKAKTLSVWSITIYSIIVTTLPALTPSWIMLGLNGDKPSPSKRKQCKGSRGWKAYWCGSESKKPHFQVRNMHHFTVITHNINSMHLGIGNSSA